MRFLFGSDIIGNQKIFGITVSATNCTNTGDSTIAVGGTASLLFTADAGYELPTTITVVGASYTWDKDTGVLILSAVTGAVTVSVAAEVIPVGVPIYGVSGLYQSDPALTRTDDAVGMNFSISSSTGLVSSDFDNAFPWNEATVETIDGNKFLHMPDMWFRIGRDENDNITDVAVSKAPPASYDATVWYKVDSFYYGCYGGSIDENNKLCSVSGVARKSQATRDNFRTYASNNGVGYQQLDLYHHTVMLFLWWIEVATKDSQSIMRGKDGSIGGSTPANTGGTDALTTPSGYNISTGQMRWHYIEDYIGNYLEFVDGVVVGGSSYYVTADPSKFNDTGTNMNTLSYFPTNASNSNRCITAYGWDTSNPFLCGSKYQSGLGWSTDFCDWGFNARYPVLYCGAYYSNANLRYGVSFCETEQTSHTGVGISGRLLYKPAA